MEGWQVWVDRGGTFTDVIARAPSGQLHVEKLLSDSPQEYEDAVVEGINRIVKRNKILPSQLSVIKMGTTVATNALLERKGQACALLITRGFRDLLDIGFQNRPDLFALHVTKLKPLYHTVIEIDERIDAQGWVIEQLDQDSLKQKLHRLTQNGIESIAIVLMHSIINPQHELKIAELAQKAGIPYVYCSHRTGINSQMIRRGNTCVIQAYLSPKIQAYTQKITQMFSDTTCYFMQSNGGLCKSTQFSGKNSLLSGPAGGVVGTVKSSQELGFEKILGFDMGGTSTDVCHYAGGYERLYESNIHGYLLDEPMLHIHTVAAGGGSILTFQDGRMQVGPESAGAFPGPACYRRGGPLTVTDANVLLGKIPVDSFPPVFEHRQGLDLTVVTQKFNQLAAEIPGSLSVYQVAQGFIDIAVHNMSNAVKRMSVDKGIGLTGYVLNCFGGAGAQHACLIANQLGIRKIIINRLASVLSAYGIGVADESLIKQHLLDKPLRQLNLDVVAQLKNELTQSIGGQSVESSQLLFSIRLLLKYQDSDTPLEITLEQESLTINDRQKIARKFHSHHRLNFGFSDQNKLVWVQAVIVEAVVCQKTGRLLLTPLCNEQKSLKRLYTQGTWHDVDCIVLSQEVKNRFFLGPMLIQADNTTVVVEPGWQAEIDSKWNVILTQVGLLGQAREQTGSVSPITLEIFNKAFMHSAELMGSVLAKTSASINIKERRDYSCALFDEQGNLIANAPHIPVHLGSMSESVKQILADGVREGCSYLMNNPYRGGTHLPDITVITPVYLEHELTFFVASRGHHADVGGIAPGSLPANSRTIADEGLVIDNFTVVKNGCLQKAKLYRLLVQGGVRNPAQNMADIKAQLAANQKGISEINRLVVLHGLPMVSAYVKHIQHNATQTIERILNQLHPGAYRYEMDGGKHIDVTISINKQQLAIDFSHTSRQQPDNFNTPTAVVKAAVLYVLRTLVSHEIPLNEGCLLPVKLTLPPASLINPQFPHAVVAGNVETSQAIVNCLYAALNIMAAAQGTMNNLTFGTDEFQYYETLCGGTGAGNGFNGCDAIHSHMTNSLLTDPEVLEIRFPVRLIEFSIRTGSGGLGLYHGGNGVVRKIQFLQSMQVNMISNHRETAPPGIAGGNPGRLGCNELLRTNGKKEQLPGCFAITVMPGDCLIIKTPGGGGYGREER